ncbi:hypothetical protein OAP14_00745 [Aliiglaciecola sp.]|nr:hypothetical protein [Aliiglaciecola sp.]
MTDKSGLFLVQSPLHIYNACEAIRKFDIAKPTFLIVTSKHNVKWSEMMRDLLPANTEHRFCERDDLDIAACTKEYVGHIQFFKQQKYDYVFFSDSRLYIFVDIVNSLQNENTFLMDDGSGIIQTVHTLEQTGRYFDTTQSSQKERRQEIEKIKRKYDLWQLASCKYNLFTAFDFKDGEHFKVVANPMRTLCHKHEKLDHQSVLILGVPFIKINYMSSEKYCDYLVALSAFYTGKRLLYLPHPREDMSYLHSKCIDSGIEVVSTHLTAEKYLMSLNPAPAIVTGFYSAALWYIAKFQPEICVEAHRFHLSDITLPPSQMMSRSSHLSILDIVDLVYDYYTLRMRVIEPLLKPSVA